MNRFTGPPFFSKHDDDVFTIFPFWNWRQCDVSAFITAVPLKTINLPDFKIRLLWFWWLFMCWKWRRIFWRSHLDVHYFLLIRCGVRCILLILSFQPLSIIILRTWSCQTISNKHERNGQGIGPSSQEAKKSNRISGDLFKRPRRPLNFRRGRKTNLKIRSN